MRTRNVLLTDSKQLTVCITLVVHPQIVRTAVQHYLQGFIFDFGLKIVQFEEIQ